MRKTTSILCILLGASNLSRAYQGLVHYLERGLHPRPVRFLNALGPGRGYCAPGGLLNVVYPPIGACGILDSACMAGEERILALVTDIGNDIMYDVPAAQIIDSLDKLFAQLKERGADILVTVIPRYLEKAMDDFHFRCLRAAFFPKSRVEMHSATSAVREINSFLQAEATGRITLISGLEDCYSFDKIHFSPIKMHRAWTRIAKVMLTAMEIETSGEIRLPEMLGSLGSHVFRLTLSDMFRVYDKGHDYF